MEKINKEGESEKNCVLWRTGCHREIESERYENKYRAIIEGEIPNDEPVGQRWASRARQFAAKANSFVHRNKVSVDRTVWKIDM